MADDRSTALSPATSVSVGTSVATLLPANGNRVSAYITNTSNSYDAYLALGGSPVGSAGICLKAGGGAVVVDDYTGLICAIAAGAGAIISFSEV